MPWVIPSSEDYMTSAEFDDFMERFDEDYDSDTDISSFVWVERGDLFDHTNAELDEMDRKDVEEGREPETIVMNFLGEEDLDNDIPDECRHCGGPYPLCSSGCDLMDD